MNVVPGRHSWSAAPLLCIMLLLSIGTALAGDDLIDFESDEWVLLNAEVVEHLGRKCLIGAADLPRIDFVNGIIEYDIAVDGSRSYPGINFRATSPLECENFYIRPHASKLPDALQYTPVWSGVAGWQLYHGEGFTAAAEIPRDRWFHVRLEILGKQARVYLDGQDEPSLVVHDLKHDVARGAIGIRSPRNRSVFVSNFRVVATEDLQFEPPPERAYRRGLVKEWEISQPFNALAVARDAYPSPSILGQIEWRTVASEPNGLLDFCRHVPRSPSGEVDLIYARLFLDADQDEIREFSFGYSDIVKVFLNGDLLFTGNSSYRSRSDNFPGIVSLEDAVHLPLRKGRNELMFMVIETFGGWGLIGQDGSDDYLRPGIDRMWELTTELRMPESAVYDPERRRLYVSSFFAGGNEFLSKITLDGTIEDREWITGLRRPTGLAVQGDRLWTVDRAGLVEIDIEAGTILGRYEVPGAVFLNDIALDRAGTPYITDSGANRIYTLRDGEIEIWLDGGEVRDPNGILVDRGLVLFGNSGDGCLKSADLTTKEVRTIARLGAGSIVDGLRGDGRGNYLVSDFNGRLLHVDPGGQMTEWLNTTASGATCADLEYIPDENLLVVPGLYDNRLTAYRIEDAS